MLTATKMRIDELKETVNISEGVTVNVDGATITVKGSQGEIKKSCNDSTISIKVDGNSVVLTAKNASKKQKRILETMVSHIENMIEGVKNNYEYKLKICASHFPMQVAMEGNTIVVKNFFGEKIPRKKVLSKDVQVKVQGDKIIITGADIEKVGETAARIEQTCETRNKDKRVFQDGIYLIEKNGRAI